MTFRVAAIGSRAHVCLQEIGIYLDSVKFTVDKTNDTLEIVTGSAPGANDAIQEWCKKNNVPCIVIPIDWSLGDEAGCKVNSKILENASMFIAFWDGRSENTLDAIIRAKKLKDCQTIINVR